MNTDILTGQKYLQGYSCLTCLLVYLKLKKNAKASSINTPLVHEPHRKTCELKASAKIICVWPAPEKTGASLFFFFFGTCKNQWIKTSSIWVGDSKPQAQPLCQIFSRLTYSFLGLTYFKTFSQTNSSHPKLQGKSDSHFTKYKTRTLRIYIPSEGKVTETAYHLCTQLSYYLLKIIISYFCEQIVSSTSDQLSISVYIQS